MYIYDNIYTAYPHLGHSLRGSTQSRHAHKVRVRCHVNLQSRDDKEQQKEAQGIWKQRIYAGDADDEGG